MKFKALKTLLKVEKESETLPLFSDPRLFEELFCISLKWTSSAVSGLNQLTNTRNYTVKEKIDFGNPKKLRFLTICILFRVLKRLEEEEGGGGGIYLQTLWHALWGQCTFLKNQIEDAR